MPRGIGFPIPVPIGGIRSDRSRHLLSTQECLSTSRNINILDGVLACRRGYGKFAAVGVSEQIMGIFNYQESTVRNTVMGTKNNMYVDVSGVLTLRTGPAITGGDNDHMRFTAFNSGATTFILATNNVNQVQVTADPLTINFANLTGSPPTAVRDITVAANRVILGNVFDTTRRSSRIRVSSVNDHTSWPTTLFADLSATEDTIVAVEKLTRTNFAIYKDDSQWVGIAQAGSFPFRFELIDRKPGPVTPAVVVPVGNEHYYLGQDHNIYRFDGTRCVAIGDSVVDFLQTQIQQRNRSHGAIQWEDDMIVWFYSSAGFPAVLDQGIAYNIKSGAFWPFAFATGFTASAPIGVAFAADRRILMGTDAVAGDLHRWGNLVDDDGTNITYNWDTPFFSPAGIDKLTRLNSMDLLWHDPNGSHIVTTAFELMVRPNNGTVTYAGGQTVDPNVLGRLEIDFADVIDRWIGFRFSGTNASSGLIRSDGAILFYDAVGID